MNTQSSVWIFILVAISIKPSACAGQDVQSHTPQAPNTLIKVDTEATQMPPIPTVKYPAEDQKTLKELYYFAATHPEVLRYVPCYCLCSKNAGHHSNEDCFVKSLGSRPSDVVWDAHAAECVICTSVAKEAKQLFLAGHSVKEIRDTIDRDFRSKFKNRTDTPEPPNTVKAAEQPK